MIKTLLILLIFLTLNSCVKNKYISDELPTKYSLEDKSSFTPFSPTTTIAFDIPESVLDSIHVLIVIYNVTGAIVDTVENQYRPPGRYEVTWDAKGFTSGIYFYKIIAGEFRVTKKMVLLK